MKCPFRITVVHKDERTEGYVKYFASDEEEYGECYKEECPYYIHVNKETCGKARKEIFKEVQE